MAEEKQKQDKPQAKQQTAKVGTGAAALKKKKKWYPIIAPKMFNNIILGETILNESAQLNGKALSMSMMNIAFDPKRQHINIHFKVTKVVEGKGMAQVTMYEIPTNWFRRMVRRGRKKISDSFVCKTSDGIFAEVKPIIITQGEASNSTATDIMKHCRQLLKEIIHTNTFETVIQDLLDFKVQMYLKDMLRKIYPIRTVEIRVFGLTSETKETVDNILRKPVVLKEEEEEEFEEGSGDQSGEQSVGEGEDIIDQAGELKESRKRSKKAAEEEDNPISEGV